MTLLRALAVVCGLALTGGGCAGAAPTTASAVAAPAATPVAAGPTPQPTAEEPSVRPGANATYQDPNLDVGAWLTRFERGGREIFERRHQILRAARVGPGMDVADVGAGTGLFSDLFADAVGPRGRVFAVDIARPFLDHIDKRARERGLTNVTTVLGTDRSPGLPAQSVDLIFLCDSYHHFEYPRSMNRELFQALRPGGTLVLIDYQRVPGTSAAWVLEHVRAGNEVFTAELEAAGFERIEEVPLLKENYMLRFRKSSQPSTR